MYQYDEVLKESQEYFEGQELPAKVFVDKYALRDNEGKLVEKTPDDTHKRLAREFARIEKKKYKTTELEPLTEKQIYDWFYKFGTIIAQGSPTAAIGNTYQFISTSNCFDKNTEVLTNNGVKKISEVKIGDTVITHTGNECKVVQLHKNRLDNRAVFDLKCYRTPSIKVTENHKFLSISKEQLVWGIPPTWNRVDYLREGDYICIPNYNSNKNHSKKINIYDIIDKNTIKPQSKKVNQHWVIDKDFAYFLGLWYGDGCVFSKNGKSSGITFTFHHKEEKIIEFVERYGSKLFGFPPSSTNNKHVDGSYQIVFHSNVVARVVEQLFGRGCGGKKMYQDCFSWNKTLFMFLLQGLLDSDGTITSVGQLRIVLKNRRLVKDFYHLSRKFNIPMGISSTGDYYRLDFPKDFDIETNKIYEDNRLELSKNRPQSKFGTIEINGDTFVKIRSKTIDQNYSEEFVYTIGVEQDHSYSVEGLVSQNCFVLESPEDSYGGILKTDEELVQISKRRGGIGIDLSKLRPTGSSTLNSSRTSTGIKSWMGRYSNSIREVGQGGRRGALMLSVSVHHPDIMTFITAKNNNTDVTGANISVRVTDEFLEAVKNNTKYEQRFPVDSPNPITSTKVSAREVWDAIIKNAHDRAEPGVLFWDNIIKDSPADCYADLGFKTISTNPCGEIPLSAGDSCRLIAINMFHCVENPYTKDAKINFSKLYETAKMSQRLLDDLIDLEIESIDNIIKKIKKDPECDTIKQKELSLWLEIRSICKKGRRTGLGLTVLGDALAACNIKYGSKKSIETVDKIYKTIKFGSYTSSMEMAKELGAFPIWDWDAEKNNPFLLRIKDETLELEDSTISGLDLYKNIKKNGRRNISNLTTAPTGSISILAGINVEDKWYHNTSSGIEPVYMLKFTRRKKGNPGDEDFRTDFVDENGDHWMEFDVYHTPAQAWMNANGKKSVDDSCPYVGCTSPDINWTQRVKLQAAAQKHVDHSISSTVNLPNDVAVDEVKKIYNEAWKSGCKGITIYRDGCRSGVLVQKKEEKEGITRSNAPKRSKSLPCDIHTISVNKEKFTVIVGLVEGSPYEVFCVNDFIEKEKHGELIKASKGQYKLITHHKGEEYVMPLKELLNDDDRNALMRMISTSLRHGADIQFVVEQLIKTSGHLTCMSKSIARALKKYINDGVESGESCPECGSKLIYQEGCLRCESCGFSKCG